MYIILAGTIDCATTTKRSIYIVDPRKALDPGHTTRDLARAKGWKTSGWAQRWLNERPDLKPTCFIASIYSEGVQDGSLYARPELARHVHT